MNGLHISGMKISSPPVNNKKPTTDIKNKTTKTSVTNNIPKKAGVKVPPNSKIAKKE